MKMKQVEYQHRKDEHLSLALKYWKEKRVKSSFEQIRLVPNDFADLSIDDIDLSSQIFGKVFDFPFYIEAMTGGTSRGDKINAQLALIAKNQGLAMAVGSQSIALKYPELAEGFKKVRTLNPQGFLFANLGANHDLEDAKRAVDMIEADALELHINMAQELVMDEGDRSFLFLKNIQEISENLKIPVIVKEVGNGISRQMLQKLSKFQIAAINVAGAGGTNFPWIERKRNNSQSSLNLDNYGFTTLESLWNAKKVKNIKPLIAAGGIASSQDIVKAQVLGASLTSSAGFFLKELVENGPEALEGLIENWKDELKRLYLLLAVKNFAEIQKVNLFYSQE